MTGRRRQDGRPTAPGQDPAAGARTRGAWTTPAVVVRGPDGRVVDAGDSRRSRDDDDARRRVRPRRIPGAPGAVLLTPSLLTDAADDREARRRRRREAPVATVTPLPARPPPADDAAAADGDDGDAGGRPARPRLRPVQPSSAATPARPDVRRQRVTAALAGLGARRQRVSAPAAPARPGPRHRVRTALARPGPRRHRVRAALAGLNFDRLLPPDEEARARRALRLRRCATVVASVGLVVVLVYSVFPVRTWIDQRAEADRAREQQEVFERENARLEQEARDLRTDERIEELARELGLVMPGEELYGVLPGSEEPADTPPTTVPDD
ncbi:MAG TPA: septum formation initiator family protein [Acidimicrobiales bacterium]|nr:septum formation initiator family protein [Acidimicrobiales bacterium]